MCLYVDDLMITGDEEIEIERFKENMNTVFEMTSLGIIDYFLGLEVVHSLIGILLHQRKYIQEVLKRFKMTDCNAVPIPVIGNQKPVDATLYKQLMGSLSIFLIADLISAMEWV